jgi:HEAT repeat protein
VQAIAADALGAVRDADGRAVGVEPLLLALDGEASDVRAAAARALGVAGDARVVEALRRHVRGETASVSIAALEALRHLDPGSLDDLLVDMLAHQDREVVKQALMGLSESADARAVTRLAIGLTHADWAVRRLAATLLSERGGAEALQALRERATLEGDELVLAVIERALASAGAR